MVTSEPMRTRASILVGLLCACGSSDAAGTLAFVVEPDGPAARSLTRVEVRVTEGYCFSGVAAPPAPIVLSPTELDAPRDLPALTPGAYGLSARGLDRACRFSSSGCADVEVPGDEGTVAIRLRAGAAAEPSCVDPAWCPAECAEAVVGLAAGAHHTCALDAEGAIGCWGDGVAGQLGDGALASRSSHAVVPLSPAVSLASGDRHTCAIAGGELCCWGARACGDGGRPTCAATSATAIAAGGDRACVVLADGSVACLEPPCGEPSPRADVRGAVDVAVGRDHVCALAGGRVLCWGDGALGQLGRVVDGRDDAAAPVAEVTSAVSVAAGPDHTCALDLDGAVWCWGADDLGQLGRGASGAPGRPREVVADAVAIAAGACASCALLRDGGVTCWGADLGAGCAAESVRGPTPLPLPADLDEIDAVTAVEVGEDHACLSLRSGRLYCWGGNLLSDGSPGRLGRAGLVDARSATPQRVEGRP